MEKFVISKSAMMDPLRTLVIVTVVEATPSKELTISTSSIEFFTEEALLGVKDASRNRTDTKAESDPVGIPVLGLIEGTREGNEVGFEVDGPPVIGDDEGNVDGDTEGITDGESLGDIVDGVREGVLDG